MWLSKTAGLLDKILRPTTQVFHTLGSWILGLVMLLTAVDVFLRNAFNHPLLGTFDFTEYAMAILVSSGVAYCGIVKGHINADVIITKLSKHTQKIISIITNFLGFGLFSLVTWRTLVNMMDTRGLGIESASLYIPIFPFIGVVSFGSFLLALILLKDFLESLNGADK